ncbi:MAG TPA: YafY family protein [Casimicrobiaceae bacterium]|jgi:predicted DNA-binding transcriptional regulator YafY|nr:YafY family protein [Casimicrobiaceae bacterium]
MRRADRLFAIVQYLRGRRLTTAAQLARWLEVSERTIYRDVADLAGSGVPIDGEAGVGYRIRAGFDLPPLMFSFDEIDALAMGARFVEAWASPKLARGARSALAKIAAALPGDKRAALESAPLFAPGVFDAQAGARLDALREAIGERRFADLDYQDAAARVTQRRVRPLALYFWGDVWTLAGWCELRQDFRNFRLDRIAEVTVTERFPDESGKRLEDFLRKMRAD